METILPSLANRDRIFVQDADTVCVPRWLELANDVMDGDPRAVVSGRYACKAEYGLIGMMQRNEFARECRMIDRRGDRTHILVGTSTLLPVAMLREVIAARRTGRLPAGHVYVPESLTEDFELTLAAKTLGWRTVSPRGCDAVTDITPPLRMLWHQRIRWMQGGVEDLRRYGWTPITSPFHIRRAWILFGLASMLLFYATLAATYALSGTVVTSVPWALLTLVFIIDRVAGVRAQGRASMLFAALLVPEVLYNMFAQVVYVTALCKASAAVPGVARDLGGNAHVPLANVLARGNRHHCRLPCRRGGLGAAQDESRLHREHRVDLPHRQRHHRVRQPRAALIGRGTRTARSRRCCPFQAAAAARARCAAGQ